MDLKAILIFLAVGAVAGWLAGKIMKGGGSGLLGNMLVGVIGAVVGGFLFNLLGISTSGLGKPMQNCVACHAAYRFE